MSKVISKILDPIGLFSKTEQPVVQAAPSFAETEAETKRIQAEAALEAARNKRGWASTFLTGPKGLGSGLNTSSSTTLLQNT